MLKSALILFIAACGSALAAQKAPNVILMLIDDMGQTDLGCYGSKFYETPHVDKLAAEGAMFTQASSACTVCSPTRAALLTGQYPARLHITDWIPGHGRPHAKLLPPADWVLALPPAKTTIAELFHAESYATTLIGKWHLGDESNYPEKHGFDSNLGGTDRGQPPSYFSPYKIPTLPDGPVGEFLTDRESAEACKFIEKNQASSFFLYLPHYAVHTPIQSKKEVAAKYEAKTKASPGNLQANASYAALVENVDDSVGRIRAKLEELKLWDNTVFIFTSDNGGLRPITYNQGLRAGKGSAYEGGTRIPLIIRWPGVTKPNTVCKTPVITTDIFPTLVAGCQLKKPDQPCDGVSLLPILSDPSAKLDRDSIYWHYPHYHPGGAKPYSAVRKGDLKLIHFFEDERDELYDIVADPEEKTDLASNKPEERKALRAQLEAQWKATGAQMPRVNPAADAVLDAEKQKQRPKQQPQPKANSNKEL